MAAATWESPGIPEGACALGIRKVNFVFEVDVKKLKHGIMHSLQYPKT
jgi:hypothetical protein